MKARHFLNQLEHDLIVKAIGDAERNTSGEIRVFITRKEPEDPVKAAGKAFGRLGMHRIKEKNGVLIFLAPRVRKFAIIGDTAVHAKCGEEFWKDVTHEMANRFREGKFTDGLIHGIHRAGQLLAAHFPRRPGNGENHLSTEIGED